MIYIQKYDDTHRQWGADTEEEIQSFGVLEVRLTNEWNTNKNVTACGLFEYVLKGALMAGLSCTIVPLSTDIKTWEEAMEKWPETLREVKKRRNEDN